MNQLMLLHYKGNITPSVKILLTILPLQLCCFYALIEADCPEGFLKDTYSQNICEAGYEENTTFVEAEEICRKQSSVLANVYNLRRSFITNRHSNWHSYNGYTRDRPRQQWFENDSTVLRKNRTIFCQSWSESKDALLPRKCDPSESHPFMCIYQPFLLLSAFVFSKQWFKYSHSRVGFHFDHEKKSWYEANHSCNALPAKSSLLQEIRNLEGYPAFKVLTNQLQQSGVRPSDIKEDTFWMNLFQDGDSLKWLTTPEEDPSYVDWGRHTDFHMNRSGGLITVRDIHAYWSLSDLSSEHPSVCEMPDVKDSHPTAVYIEEGTNAQEYESKGVYEKKLKCVPSGWFVWNSINWFKDGEYLFAEYSQQQRYLTLKLPFSMKNVSEFQGHYSCSVALDKTHTKQVYSPEVLIKFPGVHTFVLHITSAIPQYSNCSHLTSFELPLIGIFNKYLEGSTGNGSRLFVQEVTCSESVISSYHHFYVPKTERSEKSTLWIFERDKETENGTLSRTMRLLNITKDSVSFRSTVSCPEERSFNNQRELSWPETPIGQSTLPDEMCITVNGRALERKCLGNFYTGAHWSPVENECVDVRSEVTITLHKLAKTNITEENILNSTQSMEVLTTREELSLPDVQYVAQILRSAARVSSVQPEVLRSIVRTVDTVIDVISSSENRDTFWNVPSKISSAVWNISLNTETNNQTAKAAGKKIAVSVLPVSHIPRGVVLEKWGSNVTLLLKDSTKDPKEQLNQLKSYQAAVLLPERVLTSQLISNRTNMAVVVHRNPHLLQNVTVISPVIDVITGTQTVYDVDPPIEMVFKISKMNSVQKKSPWGCVSWDETLNNGSGGWSYKGCYTVLRTPTQVRCYCDHLTSFAVILELNPEDKMHKHHVEVLSTITYIGCSFSIFGIGSIMLTFSVLKKFREEIRHKMLFNLCLSLMSLLLVFLIGIERTEWGYGCMAVSILLHYFILASFFWMLVDSYMQYLRLAKVIGIYIPSFLQKAMCFAWGSPFIIVSIVLGINYELYQKKNEYCWLSGNVFYFAVVFPISTLLALNFLIVGLNVYSNTCGRPKQKLRTNNDKKRRTKLIVRLIDMFSLSVLRGLSWVFGFLAAITETKLLFLYLFVITSTLQAFLLSIFWVFRRQSTRELWLDFVKSHPMGIKKFLNPSNSVRYRGGSKDELPMVPLSKDEE